MNGCQDAASFGVPLQSGIGAAHAAEPKEIEVRRSSVRRRRPFRTRVEMNGLAVPRRIATGGRPQLALSFFSLHVDLPKKKRPRLCLRSSRPHRQLAPEVGLHRRRERNETGAEVRLFVACASVQAFLSHFRRTVLRKKPAVNKLADWHPASRRGSLAA
jgi:hypothetical protein